MVFTETNRLLNTNMDSDKLPTPIKIQYDVIPAPLEISILPPKIVRTDGSGVCQDGQEHNWTLSIALFAVTCGAQK
ncbi:hypothetical protein BB561_000444 [Smittium simulii]|uniref:Uncharacterized protein n=1 Tax=Smittium simulii TaxID=133385 RepID=A0A2T9YZ93_9FUNG|nr:hypothetical protein BB561_000444 [Smittium simulii]